MYVRIFLCFCLHGSKYTMKCMVKRKMILFNCDSVSFRIVRNKAADRAKQQHQGGQVSPLPGGNATPVITQAPTAHTPDSLRTANTAGYSISGILGIANPANVPPPTSLNPNDPNSAKRKRDDGKLIFC